MRTRIVTLLLAAVLPAGFASAQQKAQVMQRSEPGAFSVILIPDPQNYVKFDYNQPVFELMTGWIAENIDSLNIRAALCTGDLVDQNECAVPPFPRFGNISSRLQWEFVAHAFERIDHRVPYLISTGNHDYGYTRAENDMTHFPEYFPIEKNRCWKQTIVSVFNNRHGVPTMENAAMEITGPGWGKMLFIALEFAPRDEVLEWARTLAAQRPEHTVFLLIHSYLKGGPEAERYSAEQYLISPANSGEQVWQKLVHPSDNIRMVICGHYAMPGENFADNVGFRTDLNHAGRPVHQMMFNSQALGGGMSGNGGEGWLRILEFRPDGRTVGIRTYSPLFGFSPQTKHLAWSTAPFNQFTITIDRSK